MEAKHTGTPLPHLAYWRILQGFTQRDLARKSGVSPTSIALLETARRYARPSTITKLALALNIEPRQLIEGDPPKKRKKAEATE